MVKDQRFKGWTLVYIIFSIPVLVFYSAGLSGWFFDYPTILFIAIFSLLAIPLLLIILKSPKAPQWNIAMLWIASILVTLRIIYGVLFQGDQNGERLLDAIPLLVGIITFSIIWAIIWTKYFNRR